VPKVSIAPVIREHLAAFGATTSVELCRLFPQTPPDQVRAVLVRLKKQGEVRITAWSRDAPFGGRIYPRALYVLGKASDRDAKKPPPETMAIYCARQRIKRGQNVARSVFEWRP